MTRFPTYLATPRARWTAVGALAVLGVAAVVRLSPWGTAPAAPAPVSAHPTPNAYRPTPQQLAQFTVQPAQVRQFRTEVVTDGHIAANADRATPVFSPYSGRIVRLLAAPGDPVHAGQPLFAVEATEFVQVQSELVAAETGRSTARSNLRQAQQNEQRKRGLYEAQAGALQDWQQAQAELVTAQDALKAADAALAAVQGRLRILGKSEADAAAIAQSGKVEPVATVVAPIGGTVIERPVALGQYIQAGASEPQARVADLSTVWLVANVRDADAPRLKRGVPVEVRVLALPGQVFRATVSYVGNVVDPATRRITVRAEVPNPERVLKPEMYASFTIAGADTAEAVAVPEEAVLYEADRARLWVLQADGTLALRELRVGRTNGGWTEVTQGLAAGEKVVTAGSLFIDRAARRE